MSLASGFGQGPAENLKSPSVVISYEMVDFSTNLVL